MQTEVNPLGEQTIAASLLISPPTVDVYGAAHLNSKNLSRLLDSKRHTVNSRRIIDSKKDSLANKMSKELLTSGVMSMASDTYQLSLRKIQLPPEPYTSKQGLLNKLVAEAGVGELVYGNNGELSYINSATMQTLPD